MDNSNIGEKPSSKNYRDKTGSLPKGVLKSDKFDGVALNSSSASDESSLPNKSSQPAKGGDDISAEGLTANEDIRTILIHSSYRFRLKF